MCRVFYLPLVRRFAKYELHNNQDIKDIKDISMENESKKITKQL